MGNYLSSTYGYSGGSWQGPSNDLRISNGSSFTSLGDASRGYKSAFYRTSDGTWRRFYSGMQDVVFFGIGTAFDTNRNRSAYVTLKTDGTLFGTYTPDGSNSTGEWDSSGHPDIGDWECKATKITDYGGSGGTFGSWMDLTSDKTWTLSAPPGTQRLLSFNVEIRHKPTLIVATTLSIDIILGAF